ncbi:MAG: TetR/AcrR family transcriptional regulator [Burkholderiaceae bacterium]
MSSAPLHSPRWERRKEARPGELLDAALDLFVERGFAATRLDAVAARAGVSKGTLYLYYASKEDLFKAVVRQNIVPLIDAFERESEAWQAGSDALLETFFREWWRQFGATRLAGIAKLMVGEAGNFPELALFFQQEVVKPNAQLLYVIIERGIRRGEFAQVDVEAMAQLWIAPMVMKAIWECSIQPCCPPGFAVPIDRFLDAHLRSVRAALAVPAPVPAPVG